MTRRTFDGLVAWLVYVAGLALTTLGFYGLVVHGERVAFVASVAVLAGIGACTWARHTFIQMARIDRIQAHWEARQYEDLDPVLMDLVLAGVFEFDGVDPDGTILYRLTPHGRQDHGQ